MSRIRKGSNGFGSRMHKRGAIAPKFSDNSLVSGTNWLQTIDCTDFNSPPSARISGDNESWDTRNAAVHCFRLWGLQSRPRSSAPHIQARQRLNLQCPPPQRKKFMLISTSDDLINIYMLMIQCCDQEKQCKRETKTECTTWLCAVIAGERHPFVCFPSSAIWSLAHISREECLLKTRN